MFTCFFIFIASLWSAVYSEAIAGYCQEYPSEYAYEKNSVYRTESASANCKNYHTQMDYIHCDGTPLRLTDSDFESEQYTTSDYYVWLSDETSSHQLLFIFSTSVNLTTITLHYYSDNVRGLPRLRFWSVPDDFDIWEAPTAGYNSLVEVAAVPPGVEPAGHRNISMTFNIPVVTTKLLLVKFSSSFSFALSEVEFIKSNCSSQLVSTSILKDPTEASDFLTTLPAKSTFGTTELESRTTTTATFSDMRENITSKMTATEYFVTNNNNKNEMLPAWISIGVFTTILTILVAIIVAVLALVLFIRKSSQLWRKTECDNSYSTLSRGPTQPLQPQSLNPASDLYDRIELSPSTGQTEFISKTETDNTNNPSPHHHQRNINLTVDMQQSKSTTVQIIAASSKDIPLHDIESTSEQPNYAAINKRKKNTMGKEPVHYGHENAVATNLSLLKHDTTEENKSINLPHTADKNKKLREGNAVCNQQKDGSPEELYTAMRKKTKESTAQNEEEPPPIPLQGVEQLYTAVNKKTQPTTANDEMESPPIPPHTVEELYTAVMKKPKAREADDEVEAPPVPPHTVEELYTAVQKKK